MKKTLHLQGSGWLSIIMRKCELTSGRFKPEFLQQFFIATDFHENSRAVIAVFCCKTAYTILRVITASPVNHLERFDSVIYKEITKNHFRLAFAVGMTPVTQRNIHHIVEIFGHPRSVTGINR